MSDSGTIVIGGGIAGLVTAWALASAGRQVEVIEAGSVLGGCIARTSIAGLDVDIGAESYATATPAVADLIAALGLESSIVTPNPIGAWVRHRRGSAPLPASALLGMPAHPFAADVRRVLGIGGAARAALDILLPARLGSTQATLGGLVRLRMGRAVLDRLVEPVAGGVYSTDPDELETDSVAPRLRSAIARCGSISGAVALIRGSASRPGSAVAGLSGGMFSLVDRLGFEIVRLGGTVTNRAMVRGIVRREGAGSGQWEVDSTAGLRTADNVVLALPGPAAAILLRQVGIEVPATSSATSNVALVTIVVQSAALDAHPRGTGILVSAHASGVTAKALTHATAKWAWLAEAAGPSRHVLRLSYGRGAGTLPTGTALVQQALTDAATLTGVDLTVDQLVASNITCWTSALPRPVPGHQGAMSALRAQVATQPGLYLSGSMVAGTGLAAVVADARSTAHILLCTG